MRQAPTRSMIARRTGSDFFRWVTALRMGGPEWASSYQFNAKRRELPCRKLGNGIAAFRPDATGNSPRCAHRDKDGIDAEFLRPRVADASCSRLLENQN